MCVRKACVGRLDFPSPKSLMWQYHENVWKCTTPQWVWKPSVSLQPSTLRHVTAPAESCFYSPHCTIRKKFEWHMMTINDGPVTSYFIITTRIYSICMKGPTEKRVKILFPTEWHKAVFLLRALTDNISHKSPTWSLRHQKPERKYEL